MQNRLPSPATVFWLGFLTLIIVGLWALSPILTPFLVGIVFAYILNPGADWLVKHHIPRVLAVGMMLTVLMISLLCLTLLIIPIMQREILQIQEQLPNLLAKLNETLAPQLREWFGLKVRFDPGSLKKFFNQKWAENSEDILSYLMDVVLTGSGPVLNWLANLFLMPIMTFYFLMDWHDILRRLSTLLPKRWSEEIVDMAREIDTLLAQYLRGQLLVIIVLAIYYVVTLMSIGLDLALPIGVLTGALIFIPYIGFSIGFILALLASLLEVQMASAIIETCVIYMIGQMLESFYLTPRFVGERIGLHPIAVIFVLMAFGYTFGLTGVLLALPISAAALVGLRRLRDVYLDSKVFNG